MERGLHALVYVTTPWVGGPPGAVRSAQRRSPDSAGLAALPGSHPASGAPLHARPHTTPPRSPRPHPPGCCRPPCRPRRLPRPRAPPCARDRQPGPLAPAPGCEAGPVSASRNTLCRTSCFTLSSPGARRFWRSIGTHPARPHSAHARAPATAPWAPA